MWQQPLPKRQCTGIDERGPPLVHPELSSASEDEHEHFGGGSQAPAAFGLPGWAAPPDRCGDDGSGPSHRSSGDDGAGPSKELETSSEEVAALVEMGYRADKAAQVRHYDTCTFDCSCACHARSIHVRHTKVLTSTPGWRQPVLRPLDNAKALSYALRWTDQSYCSSGNFFCRHSGEPAAGELRLQSRCWMTKKTTQNCRQPRPRQHVRQEQPPTLLRPPQCSRMSRSSIAATRTMVPQRPGRPSPRGQGPTSPCPGAQAPPEMSCSRGGQGIWSGPRSLRPTCPHLGAHASPGPTRSGDGAGRCCGVHSRSTSHGSRSADCCAQLLGCWAVMLDAASLELN